MRGICSDIPDQEESSDDDDDFPTITRIEFEQCCQGLLNRLLIKTEQLLVDAKKVAEVNDLQIDQVLLIGGSSRMPMIKKRLEVIFPGKRLNESINPCEAVAYGAALKGARLSNVRMAVSTSVFL